MNLNFLNAIIIWFIISSKISIQLDFKIKYINEECNDRGCSRPLWPKIWNGSFEFLSHNSNIELFDDDEEDS